MNEGRPPRIAVAGLGYIGRAHVGAFLAEPECTLSALVDPAPSARAFAASVGVPLHASLEALLDTERPDGIVVATPNALHVEHALLCIAAGVPMLLEKPVAPTVAEAHVIRRAAEAVGARVLVGHHRAHSPIMARAVEIVAAGTLGRIVGVSGSATFCKPDTYFEDGPWRREPGGGPILLNMIHEVHNLRMLCGEITSVQALASNAVRGFAVEDTVAMAFGFASGALGTFLLSDTAASARSWEQTSGENPAYAAYDDEDCYTIAGTVGSLAVPTMRVKRYARAEDRSWWKPFVEEGPERSDADRRRVENDPIARQAAHFAAVASGRATPLVTLADGIANLVVTEAIVEAAASGERRRPAL